MFFFMKIMQERLPIRLNRVRKTHKKQGTKLTKKKFQDIRYHRHNFCVNIAEVL